MHPRTRLCQFQSAPEDPWHPASTPIYQTATFVLHDDQQPYGYSRSGNPTRRVLEDLVGDLEGAPGSLAMASGLAALNLVLRLARPGERVIACDDLYGGTYRLLTRVGARLGLVCVFSTWEDLPAELARGASLVFAETPTNPLLRILDLERLASLCHGVGARLVIDGSTMSPLLQNPLAHGADVVVHSATKLLAGHADATAGLVVPRDKGVLEELAFFQNAEGAALSPFESWLVLRGLKTLGVRLDRQQATAELVATRLASHPRVRRVDYPGLGSHPGHEVHARQARGGGCVLGVHLADAIDAERFVLRSRFFKKTFSFGSVHSSVAVPATMSHATMPPDERARRGISDGLLRLSVGLEEPTDLLWDLDQALAP